MERKWEDLVTGTCLTVGGATAEAAWTGFLVWATSKIPHVGTPIAVLLGVTGAACTIFIANGGRLFYKNWKKQYYTIEK